MVKAFIRVVAVLLALSVPLQGFASVYAGQCMTLGHHQDAGDHAHDHDGDAAAHDYGDDGKKSSHCGPCAACCAAAVIAGPAEHSIPRSSSTSKYFFSQSPPPSVQPDGVYRPPLAL